MSLRILVVDDHAVVRRAVRALLESHEGCGGVRRSDNRTARAFADLYHSQGAEFPPVDAE